MAKQERSDLRVRELADGSEEFASFVDTVPGVGVAKLCASDSTAEEFEVAFSLFDHGRWKSGKDVFLCPSHGDKLALASVQVEPDLRGGVLQESEGAGNSSEVTSKAAIV